MPLTIYKNQFTKTMTFPTIMFHLKMLRNYTQVETSHLDNS